MGSSNKPILLTAHPRSCSTAFERMFLTQNNNITCIHEPFCDAYHFGPERLSDRFEDEKMREESGLTQITYGTVLEKIQNTQNEGKRIFIKDMAKSLIPPAGKSLSIPPSMSSLNGMQTDIAHADKSFNPTVLPLEVLQSFHFTFLIRHPRLSIPSLYKISTPPVSNITGWHGFHPQDAGYIELRQLFDYLRSVNYIGPDIAGQDKYTVSNGPTRDENYKQIEICIIDADMLLDSPERTCKAFCKSVGLKFDPSMLSWESDKDRQQAELTFHKSLPEHDVAISSTSIIPRATDHETISDTKQCEEWVQKFGSEGARVIKENVEANLPHYLYLKQFAMKV